ncbi:hypothetical protein GQ457_09G029970 [Hibiscus cannabinus]
MADAIVSLAISRILDLLIHETIFLEDVKYQVESLKAELKRMQCFLKDVDRKQEHDNRLRNRVSEIRDLAHDAEDVIDSFILERAHQGGFRGIINIFTSIFTKDKRLSQPENHKFGRSKILQVTRTKDRSKRKQTMRPTMKNTRRTLKNKQEHRKNFGANAESLLSNSNESGRNEVIYNGWGTLYL